MDQNLRITVESNGRQIAHLTLAPDDGITILQGEAPRVGITHQDGGFKVLMWDAAGEVIQTWTPEEGS